MFDFVCFQSIYTTTHNKGGIIMGSKVITVQTNTRKKGKLDQRTLTCQTLEFEGEKTRIYVIEETKRDLMRKNFIIEAGCRIIDGGTCYPIQTVICSGLPIRYFLQVSTDFTI